MRVPQTAFACDDPRQRGPSAPRLWRCAQDDSQVVETSVREQRSRIFSLTKVRTDDNEIMKTYTFLRNTVAD